MSDSASLDKELNDMILAGKALDAFEKFYAESVVMQENTDTPREGKDINRKYEQDFFASIAEFHGAELGGGALGTGLRYAVSGWVYRATPMAAFPWGTLGANLIGCLVMGMLAYLIASSISPWGPQITVRSLVGFDSERSGKTIRTDT